MLSTSLLLVSTVVSLGPHPAPSFPKDWTSSIQNDIMISQGEYSAVKGNKPTREWGDLKTHLIKRF